MVDVLQGHDIELIVMAGYGTIFSEAIHTAFPDRILNTHPALLPSFKGWHAVRDALAYGVKVTGCTVHVATLEVDAGPILAQEAVPVLPDDDEASPARAHQGRRAAAVPRHHPGGPRGPVPPHRNEVTRR